jgi:hypothetical protein
LSEGVHRFEGTINQFRVTGSWRCLVRPNEDHAQRGLLRGLASEGRLAKEIDTLVEADYKENL